MRMMKLEKKMQLMETMSESSGVRGEKDKQSPLPPNGGCLTSDLIHFRKGLASERRRSPKRAAPGSP